MRKIMVALPCLLASGLVMAKEAPRSQLLEQGATRSVLASALERTTGGETQVIGEGGLAQMEAAKRKAKAAPAPAAAPADNSKRFLMTQNGKQMTADDFDAWMKKNGYRVATGAPAKPKEEPAKQGSK